MAGLVALLVLPVAGGPAAAEGADTAPPRIHHPDPVPGEVVPAGPVSVQALVHAPDGMASTAIRIDGVPLPHRSTPEGDAMRLHADTDLADGHHEVEVEVVDTAGVQVRRRWWIAASGLRLARLAGADRVATAIAVSQRHRPDAATAGGAVLVRMDDFPDALGGAALAAHLDGPLLLTDRVALSSATANELQRVLAPGAEVHVLGGPAAVSVAVEAQVHALGMTTRRHAGSDRFATAVRVAEQLPASPAVVLASGWHFPDALAASVPAARDRMPVLLTDRDVLPRPVAELLVRQPGTTVHVVGGTAVVSQHVIDQLGVVGASARRLAGGDRYATAAAVTDAFFGPAETVVLASGEQFPDALAAAPLAASLDTSLLLTPPDRLPPDQERRLVANPPARAFLLGGPTALTRTIDADLRRAHASTPDGPREIGMEPADGARVEALPDVVIQFDRPVDGASSVHVAIDGVEVPGGVEVDGGRVTLRVGTVPPAPSPGSSRDVRIVVAAHAHGAWRHLEHRVVVQGPVRTSPRLVRSLLDDGASGVGPGDRVVALTFDDGPSMTWTPQVLDVLDRYGVPGTFFVTGWSTAAYPALARSIVARGHVVGNHTWSHRPLKGLSDTAFASEVDHATATIEIVTGQRVRCLRPPYGSYDQAVVTRAAARGLHTAMWTVDTQDWTRPGPDVIARAVLDDLRPGAVYLLHDGGGDRSQTVAALPSIIEGIHAAGYGIAVLCR